MLLNRAPRLLRFRDLQYVLFARLIILTHARVAVGQSKTEGKGNKMDTYGVLAFLEKHGAVINAALDVYSEYMAGQANDAMAAYDAIKDNPAKRAEQDKTFMTTEGLRMSSQMFMQAAKDADRAQTELMTIL
jgi:hypothetical protein